MLTSFSIFDLKRRKELGTMVEHNGTINALEFFGQSHLLTASDDGKVALFRTSDWECLHVLLHKAPISDVAVHPSGKLAISVSARDKSLRLWNLVTGKQASKAKTPKPVNKAVWSRTGRYYALLADTRIFLYDAENGASLVAEIPSSSRLLTATFFNDSHLLFAGEGSVLHCWDIEAGVEKSLTLDQKPRIKDMTALYSDQADLLITVASEGSVCIWDMASIITPTKSDDDGIFRYFIAKHSIKGLRPICMTACLQ
jgi:protein MAK11